MATAFPQPLCQRRTACTTRVQDQCPGAGVRKRTVYVRFRTWWAALVCSGLSGAGSLFIIIRFIRFVVTLSD